MLLKQSTTRNRPLTLIDLADHIAGLPGATLVITLSKDGGAFAAITPTVTDRGSGRYSLALTAAHTDTLGALSFHVTAAGADPLDWDDEVCVDLPGGSVSSVTGNVLGNVNGSVGGVSGNVTGNVSGNVVGSVGSVLTMDKTGYRLSATGVDDIHDEAVDGVTTLRESLRLANTANGGKLSGANGTEVHARDLADTKDRVIATVDADGNRTAVLRDLT